MDARTSSMMRPASDASGRGYRRPMPARSAITATAFAVADARDRLLLGMDAVMKALTLAIGTYNAMLWRTLAGALIAGAFFFGAAQPLAGRAAMRVHLIRGADRRR